MATPITGAISLSNVRTELGLSGAISLNDTLVRQLTNQLSGTATLGNALAAASVNSSVNNLNVLTGLFGSSGTSTAYKVLVRSGVTVGATAGNTALVLGQFATGSTIVINNYGSVLAYGGAGGSYYNVGSSGGDAIFASYANQTVTINNQTGALIYGGGGGGGSGGPGGTGGSGGGGVFTSINYQYSYFSPPYYFVQSSGGNSFWTWNSNYLGGDLGTGPITIDGITYYRGSFRPDYDKNGSLYEIGQSTTNFTSGGSGGGGGAGGAGGRGQGSDGANAGGAGGATGAGGAAGGTNAGAGGQGGSGGTGATGGTYGNAGGTGNGGATGNTGASGNNGGGSAGSGGGAGRAGGSAGRYLVKGGNSVTLNNSGTVAGGLA
jgi:hypothetical protein